MAETQAGGARHTHTLILTNNNETALEFFVEPEGMSFLIPPKAAFTILYRINDGEAIDVVFEKDYISVGLSDLPFVYYEGYEIHPENKHPGWRN